MQLIRDKWYLVDYAGLIEKAKYFGTINDDQTWYVFAFVAVREDGTTYPCSMTLSDYCLKTKVKEFQE